MINCLIFILISYPEIKTEGIELHYSLSEQKAEYITYEPIFVRVSIVNKSSDTIYVLPIKTDLYTKIFTTHDDYDDLPTTFKVDITWSGFPLSSDKKKWSQFFQPLEKGDSIYKYIYINKDWEYHKLPKTTHQYYLEIIRHGYVGSLENCPFSPVAGRIEKEPHSKFFSVTSPREAEEYELIITIIEPIHSTLRKTWEEKTKAYNKLLKEYPNSPYIPLAMSIMEKRKFLENYPNYPLVYKTIEFFAYNSVHSKPGVEGLYKDECLDFFNSILKNEKYKGTLLEDAILLWIDDVEKGEVDVGRSPSSTYRKKLE